MADWQMADWLRPYALVGIGYLFGWISAWGCAFLLSAAKGISVQRKGDDWDARLTAAEQRLTKRKDS